VKHILDGARVLLVEDAPYVRDALQMLLESEGADVAAVATGQEALAAAQGPRFDLLLTDLALPDLTGEVVIRGVLARPGERPRVVALTGSGEPYQSRARAAGADAIVEKPVEWSVLLRTLSPRAA
jgi:two-component system chemotaxis response regulator CheY